MYNPEAIDFKGIRGLSQHETAALLRDLADACCLAAGQNSNFLLRFGDRSEREAAAIIAEVRARRDRLRSLQRVLDKAADDISDDEGERALQRVAAAVASSREAKPKAAPLVKLGPGGTYTTQYIPGVNNRLDVVG